MKKITKLLALTLALVLGVSLFQIPAFATPAYYLGGIRYDKLTWNDADFSDNPFGTAKYYNGFILGNVDNIVDTEGALALSGNLTSASRGYSQSAVHPNESGAGNYSTFNANLVVGGNISLKGYAVVKGGHIVTSAGSTVTSTTGSDVFVKAPASAETAEFNKVVDMYKANNFSGFAVQNGNTQLRANQIIHIKDSQIYSDANHLNTFFSTAKTKLKAKGQALAATPQTAGVSLEYNQWSQNIDITCVPNAVNYITLDFSATAAGSYLAVTKQTDPMNFTMKGQMIFKNLGTGIAVVNMKMKDGAVLNTSGGTWGIDGSNKDLWGQVMINITQAATIKHTSKTFWASLLAPEVDFHATSGGCVYGTSVLKSIKSEGGFELHNFAFKGFPNGTPDPTPSPLGWMRSTEIKDASFLRDVITSGDAWNFDLTFSKTPIKYFENEDVRTKANQKVADGSEVATPAGEQLVGIQHIWDKGNYFDRYKLQNADVSYDWASWSHHGTSGNTEEKGQYSIRRFAAYVEYSQSKLNSLSGVYLAPKDELGERSYLFPINDNVFVFVNGTLAYWGGTDIAAGNNQYGALNRTNFAGQKGIKVRSGVNGVFKNVYPHTDGWCIDLEENKAAVNIKPLLKDGFNRIDIITDEYWEGGGMNRLYLFDE